LKLKASATDLLGSKLRHRTQQNAIDALARFVKAKMLRRPRLDHPFDQDVLAVGGRERHHSVFQVGGVYAVGWVLGADLLGRGI
jgi:hypothetical protein